MQSKSTKNISKASAKNETSLDCEAHFSLKLKKVEPKSPLYLILVYVLIDSLLSQNHLLLAFREIILFNFGE